MTLHNRYALFSIFLTILATTHNIHAMNNPKYHPQSPLRPVLKPTQRFLAPIDPKEGLSKMQIFTSRLSANKKILLDQGQISSVNHHLQRNGSMKTYRRFTRKVKIAARRQQKLDAEVQKENVKRQQKLDAKNCQKIILAVEQLVDLRRDAAQQSPHPFQLKKIQQQHTSGRPKRSTTLEKQSASALLDLTSHKKQKRS